MPQANTPCGEGPPVPDSLLTITAAAGRGTVPGRVLTPAR